MKIVLFTSILVLSLASLPVKAAPKEKRCDAKFTDLGLCAQIEFTKKITRKDASEFKVTFYDIKTKNIVSLVEAPKAYLWMVMSNGHGHGSEDLKLKKVKDTYHFSNAWFLMMGEWQIKMKVKSKKKSQEVVTFVCIEKDKEKSALGKCK